MNAQDLRAIAEAIGWPLAVGLFVLVILAKNGWVKVILRDDKKDEVTVLKAELTDIKIDMARLEQDNKEQWRTISKVRDETVKLHTDVAVLNALRGKGD